MRKVGFVIYLIMMFASFALNIYQYRQSNNDVYDSDTISTTIIDTIAYHQPSPKEENPLGNITVKLPIRKNVPDDKEDNFPNKTVTKLPDSVQKLPDSVQKLPDSVQNFSKSVPEDSVTVQIPITQTVYKDSTYTAYVSGYRASLDSLIFKMPREVVTIKEHSKPKRWSVGVQVGYGITLKGTPQCSPYIGIGISYNIFSF